MPVYTRAALPALSAAHQQGGAGAPLAPGPVLLPGLVYGKADHVLAFWLYGHVRGDFHAAELLERSAPPRSASIANKGEPQTSPERSATAPALTPA